MVESFVTLIGNAVSAGGNGRDSINVTLSRGRVLKSGKGRSMGEHATRMCRRWEFDV
jgi:hypothetical protein